MGDSARAIISEISQHDLDTWIRTSTFTSELEEVNVAVESFDLLEPV